MSLTLVTGVPGSSKTLYTVAVLLQDLLKSTVEIAGESKPVKLFTNIKNLLLEHDHINADNLNKWPEWAQAGDVICFDEVQEVWRIRAMGVKPSPAIEKLETHRHMGVDLILITQHPMLLDQNIRRLVGRHIHFRPFQFFGLKFAVGYEWDHASNPAMVKSAMSTFTFWHKKKYYALYKSAEAHTKQNRKMPFAIWILGAALLALLIGSPMLFKRLDTRFNGAPASTTTTTVTKGDTANLLKPPVVQNELPDTPEIPKELKIIYPLEDLQKIPTEFKPVGCIATKLKCTCYGQAGDVIEVIEAQCRKASTQIALLASSKQYQNTMQAPMKSSMPQEEKTDKNFIQPFIDSGFNLPIKSAAEKYKTNYSTEQSGVPYYKNLPAGGVMFGGQ